MINNSTSVVDFDELQKMLSDLATGIGSDIEAAIRASTPPTTPPIGRANHGQLQHLQSETSPPATPTSTSTTTTASTPTPSLTKSGRFSTPPLLQKEISLDALRQVHENSPLHRGEKPYQRKINPLPRLMLDNDEEDGGTATANDSSYSSDTSSDTASEPEERDPETPEFRPRAQSHLLVQQMDEQLRKSGIRLSSVLDLSMSSRLPNQRSGSISAVLEDNEEEYQLQQEFEEAERRVSVANQQEAQRRQSILLSNSQSGLNTQPPAEPTPTPVETIPTPTPTPTPTTTTTTTTPPAKPQNGDYEPTFLDIGKQESINKMRADVLYQLDGLITSGKPESGHQPINISISESTRNLILEAHNLEFSITSSTLRPRGGRPRTESIAERWDLGRSQVTVINSNFYPINTPTTTTTTTTATTTTTTPTATTSSSNLAQVSTPTPTVTVTPTPATTSTSSLKVSTSTLTPTPTLTLTPASGTGTEKSATNPTISEMGIAPRRSQSLNIQRVGEEFNIFRASPMRKPNPDMPKMLIHVSLVDHSHKVICVTEDFFVQDVINLFSGKMALVQTEYFSLCEQTTDGYDRWLDPTKLVADAGIRNLSKLIFKIKYFKQPKKLNDPKAVHLYYLQIQNSVVNGTYPCSEAMALRLAALQFYITFGAHDKDMHVVGFLDHETLIGFVPQSHFHGLTDEYIQRRLFKLHSQIKCNTIVEAKLRYLDLSNKIPTFGVTSFPVFDAARDGTTVRNQRTLCVAENGILIARKDKTGYDFFNYKDIISCQSTTRGLKIQIPFSTVTQNTSEVMNFDTSSNEQTNNIIELITGYKYFIQYDESTKGLCPPPTVDLQLAGQFALFLSPKARAKSDPLRSRAELFKSIYLQLCTTFNTKPLMKFIDQVDEILDKEGSFRNVLLYTTVDLSSLNLRAADLSFVADALRDAFNTPILEGETLVENLDLHTIDLSNNPLLGSDVAEPFKILLQAAETIVNINLKNIGITNKGLGPFISIFEKLDNIESLHIGKNRIFEVGVNAIVKSLKKSQLHTLSIEETNLLDEGCNTIRKLVSKRKLLTSLNISKNKITEAGFKQIFEGIQYNTTLRELNISGNPIKYQMINRFLKWFASSETAIEKLSIASTQLNASSGAEIQKVLISNGCKLQQFDISLNDLGSNGTKAVIRGIIANNTLTDLSLSGNKIEYAGIHTLSQSLESTSQLTKISLRYCNLSSKSLYRVCKLLETNKTITSLDLSMNKFSKSVCVALAQCLPSNKTLQELFITNCEMGDKEFGKLCVGLELNEALKRIYLDMNPFGKKGLAPLVTVINTNKLIEVITLRNVNLSAKHTLEFLKKLNTNTTIQKINLSENPIFAVEKVHIAVRHGIEDHVKRLNRVTIQI